MCNIWFIMLHISGRMPNINDPRAFFFLHLLLIIHHDTVRKIMNAEKDKALVKRSLSNRTFVRSQSDSSQ